MSKAAELAALIGSQTALSNRNLIINGAMQVAQRGTSSTSSNIQTVDRFGCTPVNFDNLAFTQSQSSTAPDGFSNSWKIEVTTAETALAADEHWYLATNFEAQNLQHLQYGDSGAKSITLSFWVRSSLTGKYSVLFHQPDAARSNTPSFNVDAADTWEYKTITIVGDTSGTINNDNGNGMTIHWVLAAGTDYAGTPHSDWGAYSATDDFAHSDNVDFSAQTGTFYITGVQLEVGEQATPFEHRSFADELARCQRYYEKISVTAYCCMLSAESTIQAKGGVLQFRTEKRASPSVTFPTIGNSSGTIGYTGKTGTYVTQGSTLRSSNTVSQISVYNGSADGFSGMTAGENVMLYANGTLDIELNSEL